MNSFKSWIPILITIGTAVVAAVTPNIQHFWSAHPTVTVVLAGVWAVIKGLLPSPLQGGSTSSS